MPSGDAPGLKRSSKIAAVAVATGALALSTMAFLYEGFPVAELDLHDGSVWVTKADDLLVGHLNAQSSVLDASSRTRSTDFELFQNGNDVLVHDSKAGTLTRLDPASTAFDPDGVLPGGSVVAHGGETVAILDPADGALYVRAVDEVTGLSLVGVDPDVVLGAGAAVEVGLDGRTHAVSRDESRLYTIETPGSTPSESGLPTLAVDADLKITAVGEQTVVFDALSGTVYPGGQTTVEVPDAAGAAVQWPSAATENVRIATATALVEVPLGGGAPVIFEAPAGGSPAKPVWLAGCSYAVWSGSGAYLRDCIGDEFDESDTVSGLSEGGELRFRVNRDLVVVNDLDFGATWVISQDMQLIDNWDDVVPPPDPNDGDEESQEQQQSVTLPERNEENRPPIAERDEYGVRAGSSTVLPVTENDSDPDGDLLQVTLAGNAPSGVRVESVRDGSALQVTLDADVEGTRTLSYKASDGRGGEDEATVTLNVSPSSANAAPEQQRTHSLELELGASLEHDALQEWRDPDGDDIFLRNAETDTGDQVNFRSNGVVEFASTDGQLGVRDVVLTVSDGTNETEGVLRVDVRAPGTLGPIAGSDRVSTTAGIPLTVEPLGNDTSPSGRALRLAKAEAADGATVTPDYQSGTIEIQSAKPGTYYVQYLVTDGPGSAVGLIRIDVQPESAAASAPVAMRDLALLPVGRDVLVDVLDNDSDPAGGILVVQSVNLLGATGISAEVLEHRVLRISDLTGLDSPVTIRYTVTNGTETVPGEVRVISVPLPQKLRPPVTTEDSVVVRAGDVVNINVLDNDYHPDNDELTLLPELVEPRPPASDGEIFVDGDRLRFKAGGEAKTVYATYEVSDSQLNKTAGYVTIQVLPRSEESNSAPKPKSLTSRVIAGNSVRIPVALDGIDADGDSVELIGIASSPGKGQVTVGDTWLSYEAYPESSGRDTFTYVVRDRLGAEAVGTIQVGVGEPSAENQAPYAVKDAVSVRPGRSVAVPVLQNDSDPDGDLLVLKSEGLTVPEGVVAEVVRDRVVVTAPTEPGEYTITYTVADTLDATAAGVLLITVSPDAPLQIPSARDDRVQPSELSDSGQVGISVLENDEDPDGVSDDLSVSVADASASVSGDGTVSVPVLPESQVLMYTVTDLDGLSASAFIFVPGLDSVVPRLVSTEIVEVASGEQVELQLTDFVGVRADRTPRVSVADSATASNSNGDPIVVDEDTLAYTSTADYAGPDAVGVLVTDGTGPDDPDGLSAFISIPIKVINDEKNSPPTMKSSSVEVAAGEDPVVVDLLALASDTDDGDLDRLSFAMAGGAPAGFQASVEGDELIATVSDDVENGAVAPISVTVTDGKSEPVGATISLTAVVTQRAMPVANDDVVAQANAGEPSSVSVLENDFNPYPETPLTITTARVDSGSGTAAVEGSNVVVTPASDFSGTVVVTYGVQDASGEPDRQAQARVTLTVQGKPDAPGTPAVESIQDKTVVLSWAPPANNGAEISGYVVSSPQGYTRDCPSTTCTLSGLTNDVEYTFTVVAKNAVGDSEASPSSAPARPDARPDTPAPPTLVFGDASLDVTWITPNSPGSAVTSFNLEISPAPASGAMQKTGVSGNSLTWDGLENGVAYQVRVQAVNRAPEPSSWSPYSAAEVPAGVPDAPGQPITSPASPVGAQAQLAVSWAAPVSDNGDTVQSYTVTASGGDGAGSSQTVTGTDATFTVGISDADYTFSVTAKNKAGDSGASPSSAPRRAAAPPGAPTTVAATAGDGSASVTFAQGALNGNRAGEISYQYEVSPGGATGTFPAGGGSISGLSNGTNYTVAVWALSTVEGVQPGARASSPAVKPYGAPFITNQQAISEDGAVYFSWAVNGNGRDVTSVEVLRGGSLVSNNHSEHREAGLAASTSVSIEVRVTTNAEDSTRSTASATLTGTSNAPKIKNAWLSGQSGQSITLNVENFPPGEYIVKCWNDVEHRNASTLEPDYVGLVSSAMPIGSSGQYTITCPKMPARGIFSIEIEGVFWTPAITWN